MERGKVKFTVERDVRKELKGLVFVQEEKLREP